MTEMVIHDPHDSEGDLVYDRNGVRRSRDGRPYVKVPCPAAGRKPGDCQDGRVPGKREGTTKQCPKCKGVGEKEVLYTRCTSFVGALEDRQNLEKWMKRTVLVGLASQEEAGQFADDALLWRVSDVDPSDREALDALADEAFTLGDGYEKAQKGTDLHGLAELVDQRKPLGDVSIEDRRDMAAWKRLVDDFGLLMLGIEVFVVQDDYKIGGTYDRRVMSYDPRLRCEVCDVPPTVTTDQNLPAVIKPKVLDLKTGRVDYGAGKMRQQIAVYAYSDDYDPETGERRPQSVCTHLGFIAHVAQGTGTAQLYAVDLVQGWKDVALSAQVREHRRSSKSGLRLIE